ncbi:glutaminase [Nocardia sp. NPDC051981]|uniref:glutaminase n=1 Tax=Nocardia sp. NPDC051981 TaxID=3155417 RepID=UPI00342C8FB0
MYELCRADTSGTPADYIPEPAAVQPDSFGICLATADRPVYGNGDLDAAFTIQSISGALALPVRRQMPPCARSAHGGI